MRKSIGKFLCLLITTLFLGGCSFVDNLFFTKPEVKEFSFSGYVWADGMPLADAKVDCGLSTTTTDANGSYKFSGIDKVVQVKVSKSGYLFPSDLVFVNSISTDVNFSGYQIFDKSGVVKNNDVAISDVIINAISANGDYSTMTNGFGEFYLPNLAGNVKVTATHQNYKFFTQSFTIAKEDSILITGTTNVSGKIEVDDDNATPDDFELKMNGEPIEISDDLTFSILGVAPNDTIVLESDVYHVDSDTVNIDGQSNNLVFNCQKYYDVSVSVVSGETILTDAVLKMDSKVVERKDNTFVIEHIYGEHELSATCKNFRFENKTISHDDNQIEINGVTDIEMSISLDYGNDFTDITASVGKQIFEFNDFGKTTLIGVSFGDNVHINSSDYYVINNDYSIIDRKSIQLDLRKTYSGKITVAFSQEILDNVKLTIQNRDMIIENGYVEIDNLYGNVEFTLELDGYKFADSYSFNLANNTLEITPYRLYSISGVVRSGDIELSNAKIYINDDEYSVGEHGEFSIDNLYLEENLTCICEGYKTYITKASLEKNQFDINLVYDITGTILAVGRPLQDVRVFAGDKNVVTNSNGNFEITNLSGNVNLTFNLTHYSIDNVSVNKSQNLQLTARYDIVGRAFNSDGAISNVKIFIVSVTDFSQKTTTTDNDGNYEFKNLSDEYILFYDVNYNASLKPASYNVCSGGIYNFADNGYAFGGKVVCGEKPLGNVKVSAGDLVTYTKDDGTYSFDLVTKSCILSLSKQGYTFQNNGMSIDDKFDQNFEVNFDSTYRIDGVVKSGDEKLSNVKVTIAGKTCYTDENGQFSISDLINTNSIELKLNNYKIIGVTSISGYASLEYNAYFDLKLKVVTGSVVVNNVNVYLNQNPISYTGDVIVLPNVKLGDIITLQKDGYVIDEYKVLEYTEDVVNINSTYTIDGYVRNAGVVIEGVEVTCGQVVVNTNVEGYFKIEELSGENTITFKQGNLKFEPKVVHGAETLDISSKYSVDGYVRVGDKTLSGVDVKVGDNVLATTNAIGYFIVNDLTSAETLNFVKEGYEFSGNMSVNAPKTLSISATYCVKGIVSSGDILLEKVKVIASNGETALTDANGYFEIYGIDSTIDLTFEKVNNDGGYDYNSFKKTNISSYMGNCNVSLTYNVIVVFSGVDDYTGIDVEINDVTETHNENSFVLENLSGGNHITFNKTNYKFSIPSSNVESATTIESSITIVYSVSGYVKTKEGTPIYGAILTAGEEKSISDINGKFTIKNLESIVKVKVKLPSWGTSYEKEVGQVSGATNLDVQILNYDFVYNLFNYSYDNLRHAKSYQVYGTGKVVASAPVVGDQVQRISTIYKKDTKGIILSQNLNYGGVTWGIDPRASVLTYVDTKNKTVKYNRVNGDAVKIEGGLNDPVVKLSAVYDAGDTSWISKTYDTYQTDLGANPEGFYAYTIDKSTIDNISNVTLNDENYEFTMSLKASDRTTYFYYQKQMKFMMPDQELLSFSYINLRYVISKDGFIKSLVIDEKYTVKASGFEVPTVGHVEFNYLTASLYETIPDINIKTSADISNSIAQSDITVVKKSNTKMDIVISNKRRELV